EDLTDEGQFRERFEAAWRHVITSGKHQEMVRIWVQAFRDSGLHLGDDTAGLRKEVFSAVCLYQYYDTPYAIDLFKSVRTMEHGRIACIAFSYERRAGIQLPNELAAVFSEYVEVLNGLPALEALIHTRFGETARLRGQWEIKYKELAENDESLYQEVRRQVEHLLEGALNGLPVMKEPQLSGRPKSFDSFFARLNQRADCNSEFYLRKGDPSPMGSDEAARKTDAYKRKAGEYVDAIENVNLDQVVRNFDDIAGTR